jgi:hypothetical protein
MHPKPVMCFSTLEHASFSFSWEVFADKRCVMNINFCVDVENAKVNVKTQNLWVWVCRLFNTISLRKPTVTSSTSTVRLLLPSSKTGLTWLSLR